MISFHLSKYIAIVVLLIIKLASATDYCSLCDNHVACNNDGKFGANCSSDRAIVKMSSDKINQLVELHNELRNKIALGAIQKFKSAAKMPSFQWDDELAYLAELNARTCVFAHDKCRNTEKYPWAGQNIALRGNSGNYENATSAIANMVNAWFSEYNDADMSYIQSYEDPSNGKVIGHFTVMVNDKNNAVGCALINYQKGIFKYNHLVCNYGFTNIIDYPVYEVGPVGSKCTHIHPVYNGLCSKDQLVDPIP